MLLVCLHFALPDDFLFRSARFVFLLLALCWAGLIIALPRMSRGQVLAVAAALLVTPLLFLGYFRVNAERIASVIAKDRPVASPDFKVYHSGKRLIYYQEQCGDADIASPFFLHLYPVDPEDLPSRRQEYGFVSHDFSFEERRLRGDGDCVAAVTLPDYAIAGIRTGQYRHGQGELWAGEFRVIE